MSKSEACSIAMFSCEGSAETERRVEPRLRDGLENGCLIPKFQLSNPKSALSCVKDYNCNNNYINSQAKYLLK